MKITFFKICWYTIIVNTKYAHRFRLNIHIAVYLSNEIDQSFIIKIGKIKYIAYDQKAYKHFLILQIPKLIAVEVLS